MKLITLFLGVILWAFALCISVPLTVANFFLVWQKTGTPYGYFLDTATSIDRWANREFRTLWRATLIQRTSPYDFGDPRETISSVLGKNQRHNFLTTTGKILAFLLDSLDKNHCQKSIAWYE